jgi:hypothetical protein
VTGKRLTVLSFYRLAGPVLKLQTHLLLFVFALGAFATLADSGSDARGRQFIGFDSFGSFARSEGSDPQETVLTSPQIESRISFNEVIVSWNAVMPSGSYLVVEAQSIYSYGPTKYYTMGIWSTDPAQHPRQSVGNQHDSAADVATDVLILHRPANHLRVRVRLCADKSERPLLKLLGISLADTTATLAPLPPNRTAWNRLIPVPERSQMVYPNGKVLCSPTTVSMLMGYWAQALNRPELDRPVPEVASSIYDSQWQGTGNWPFNTAYAGSFSGMRAFVTRLTDVSELEAWIAQGIPVGLSVDYDRLRAKGPGPNGHIVACVGFTKEGDPIINDPGTSEHVRKIFPRQNLINAWTCSRNTVYLVYPEKKAPPEDPMGHWALPKSAQASLPAR